MKPTAATFLLGILVGAALALGVRAAILELDDGKHSAHGGHAGMETPDGEPEPAPAPAPAEAPEAKGFLLDLGNEKCPIMGNKVNGRTWSEWNGIRVGHCCPPCIEDFLAKPETALDEAGIEWRDAAKIVAAVNAASGHTRMTILDGAKKKYGIVRMPEDGK